MGEQEKKDQKYMFLVMQHHQLLLCLVQVSYIKIVPEVKSCVFLKPDSKPTRKHLLQAKSGAHQFFAATNGPTTFNASMVTTLRER